MTRKRKEDRGPQRLMEFFSTTAARKAQDGGGGGCNGGGDEASVPALTSVSVSAEASEHSREQVGHSPGTQYSSGSGRSSPSASGSPVKSRPRLSDSAGQQQVSHVNTSQDDTLELDRSIHAFPTQDQPVLDTTLKSMLISLQGTIHADLTSLMQQLQSDIKDIGGRVDHVENKMAEYASTINDIIDAHDQTVEDVQWLKSKMADIEDRSRRNNIKIRGISEAVTQNDLLSYTQDLMKTILPDLSSSDLIIDRIHRLPKPAFLSENIPRDVLLRIHFFHVKERLLLAVRQQTALPEKCTALQFFPDLSQHTLAMRKKLTPITSLLRKNNVPYRWGFPTKILLTRGGKPYSISSIAEGNKLLNLWNLQPLESPATTSTPQSSKLVPEWRRVGKERKRDK